MKETGIKLAPIGMAPAFRYGKDTPWGGVGLRRFHKAIPDERTGESLEVSALPGLESRDASGTALPALLGRYGEAMRGTRVGETFPLLLKLISARQWLSVQVHPDDAYAFKNENGKLGKAEAWVILEAEPGAKIVFGIREGVTRAQLEEACRSGGKALEECLRFTGVRAGEVYSIPAGTVHALGGGITLAEIQQSSDVTYRFYDWNRTDAQGNRRPLHIQKGLDVVRLGPEPCACAGTAVRLDGCAGLRYVDGPAFTLDRYPVRGRLRLSATPERFRLMTALGEGILRWEGGEAQLRRGDSVFLPAMLEDTELTGELDILMMAP